MEITTTPISGREDISDERKPLAILSNFYRAFNTQNFPLMQSNWLQTEAASMSNPLGDIKRGWHEIESVYNKIFNGPASVYVEFYDYTLYVTDSVFIAVGRERGSLELNDTTLELSIRTSRIYTINEAEWKQIHHHGSMDKPELLAHYQRILSG